MTGRASGRGTCLGFLAVFTACLASPVLAQDRGGAVTGTVVDSDNQPVSDVLVFLDEGPVRTAAGDELLGVFERTGAVGAFQLEGVTVGAHLLHFRKAGFEPRTFDLVFAPNEDRRDVGVVMMEEGRDPTATVGGRITEGDSGEPLANVVVKLNGDVVALTDGNGDFQLSEAPVAWGSNELEVGRFAFTTLTSEFWVLNPDETLDLTGTLDPVPIDVGGGAADVARSNVAPRREERGGPDLIVRSELEEYPGETAYRVIEEIRRRWVRPQRSSSTAFGTEAVYARVIIDGATRRELRDLQSLNVNGIERMRYVSATDATTKYGTGYSGGVIEVTTRGR
jgi:hypothetical protein